jgi:hypothetical protein
MANLLPYWGGSPPAPDFSHYGSGYAFGGWAGASYGAAETYPAYGVYEPLSTLPDGSYCSPSVFMSWTVWEEDVYGEWQSHQLMFGSGATWYLSVTALWDWVIPWIQNRVIVGTMARWKAIYLLNNYDKVWSIVQKLRELTKSEAVLPPQMILDDGTMATADWSARELCKVLIVKGRFLDGLGQNGLIETSYKSDLFGAATWTGIRCTSCSCVWTRSGNGNWGGPPDYTSPGQPNIAAPFSLRDRLAAAALR